MVQYVLINIKSKYLMHFVRYNLRLFFAVIGLILMVFSIIVALFPNRLITSRASTLIRNSPIYRNNRYGIHVLLLFREKFLCSFVRI